MPVAKAAAGKKAAAKKGRGRSKSTDRRAAARAGDAHKGELAFLDQVDSSLSNEDAGRLVLVLSVATQRGQAEVMKAGFHAVSTVCEEDTGFMALLAVNGLNDIHWAAHTAQKNAPETKADALEAYSALMSRAASWLDGIDEVDFTQLGNVMLVTTCLACSDEDVALAALGAMMRFSLYRTENAATLLQSGVLKLCHQVLTAHRAPEVCHEVFVTLYRLCDVPGDFAAKPLGEELELVTTVVETLQQAPVNMRLQLAGLRVLALWANFEDALIRKELRKCQAPAALACTMGYLRSAGLNDQASWIDTIAGRTLSEEHLRAEVYPTCASPVAPHSP